MKPKVTVIIPTLCEGNRKNELFRAIQSVKKQANNLVTILIVVNGGRFDQGLFEQLMLSKELKVVYLKKSGVSSARAHGVSKVNTPYYCFLDDDDILLEGSLELRLDALYRAPHLDVVVINGEYFRKGERVLLVNNGEEVNSDPLLALISSNWLASCAGMFRTATIGLEWFTDLPDSNEFALLAFNMALKKKIYFIDKSGYLINNTPNSLSKTKEFILSDANILKIMLEEKLPQHIKSKIYRKLCESFHTISCYYRQNRLLVKAWQFHLRSLCYPGGVKYLSYTRKLLLPWLY